jgi:hypothetical protein
MYVRLMQQYGVVIPRLRRWLHIYHHVHQLLTIMIDVMSIINIDTLTIATAAPRFHHLPAHVVCVGILHTIRCCIDVLLLLSLSFLLPSPDDNVVSWVVLIIYQLNWNINPRRVH